MKQLPKEAVVFNGTLDGCQARPGQPCVDLTKIKEGEEPAWMKDFEQRIVELGGGDRERIYKESERIVEKYHDGEYSGLCSVEAL